MKVNKYFLILFFILGLVPALAAFEIETRGAGGRIYGLGGSGAALRANTFGNFVNPAGLSGLSGINFSTAYSTVSEEVSFKEVCFSIPLEWGVFSVAYIQSVNDEIYRTTLGPDGRPVADGTFSYDNNFFSLGLARDFGAVTAGAVIKYSRQNLAGSRGQGYNLDAGIIYPLDATRNLGLVIKNIVPGSRGAIKWSTTGTSEIIPMRAVLGYYQEFPAAEFFIDGVFSRSEPVNFKAGVELQAVKFLAIRFGAEQVTGYGSVVATRLTVGLGVSLGNFDLDYCYLPGSFGSDINGHYFSLTLGFK